VSENRVCQKLGFRDVNPRPSAPGSNGIVANPESRGNAHQESVGSARWFNPSIAHSETNLLALQIERLGRRGLGEVSVVRDEEDTSGKVEQSLVGRTVW
jgi:hypothetical protein